MKIKNVELLATGVMESQYPETEYPEVAFAGRSNVGKSSLINVLINRKRFARTSSSPGKTQTINFYMVNDMINLVDLPGYGYAKVSKKEREKWGQMIEKYLSSRSQLKDVFLLVDIRHEPSKDDLMMYQWIKKIGFEGYVIATKADKISNNARTKNISVIKKKLGIENIKKIIPFSATQKLNRDTVWDTIFQLAEK